MSCASSAAAGCEVVALGTGSSNTKASPTPHRKNPAWLTCSCNCTEILNEVSGNFSCKCHHFHVCVLTIWEKIWLFLKVFFHCGLLFVNTDIKGLDTLYWIWVSRDLKHFDLKAFFLDSWNEIKHCLEKALLESRCVGPAGEGPTYTSHMYFLKEMMQGCSKIINTDFKDFYVLSISNKCSSFELSVNQRIKKCIMFSKEMFQHG